MILDSYHLIRDYTEKGYWGTDTLSDLFLRNVAATPQALALIDPPNRADLIGGDPQRLTYAELKRQSRSTCHWPDQLGCRQR
jgi:non-ribosomal peptide synthetase component E (peptide arylation enzyme)